MLKRIYLRSDYKVDEKLALSADNFHYLTRVIRLKHNDSLEIFDGDGKSATARLLIHGKNSASVEIVNLLPDNLSETGIKFNIVQSFIKPDRLDYVLQKATEIGASSITLLHTEYGSQKILKDYSKKATHWDKVVISAAEQSRRSFLPQVLEPIALKDYLASIKSTDNNILLDPRSQNSINDIAENSFRLEKQFNIFIGPEGGFSDKEVELIKSYDVHDYTLGARILRVETVTPVILSILNLQLKLFQ